MAQPVHHQGRERRTRRSEVLRTALHYQLLYCVERFGLDAMVLADTRGMVIASSEGASPKALALAAYAPLLARKTSLRLRERVLESLSDDGVEAALDTLAVRRIEVVGVELVLCALGTEGARKHLAICRAMEGVRRMLG